MSSSSGRASQWIWRGSRSFDVPSRHRRPERAAQARARGECRCQEVGVRAGVEDFFLSVVSVLEVAIGITRLRRRDSEQVERLRSWLEDEVLDKLSERLLPIGLEVAQRTALLPCAGFAAGTGCVDRGH